MHAMWSVETLLVGTPGPQCGPFPTKGEKDKLKEQTARSADGKLNNTEKKTKE